MDMLTMPHTANKAVQSGKAVGIPVPANKYNNINNAGTSKDNAGHSNKRQQSQQQGRVQQCVASSITIGRQHGCNKGPGTSATKATAPMQQGYKGNNASALQAKTPVRQVQHWARQQTTMSTTPGRATNEDKHNNNAYKY